MGKGPTGHAGRGPVKGRTKWQGMWTIVRFNWPFFLVALVSLFACLVATEVWWGTWGGMLSGLAVLGLLYFLIGSLGVSHLIYDRSDLYRFDWLEKALGETKVRRAVFCHSGFDEASGILRDRVSPEEWIVLDHYDEKLMDEPSIRRARRAFPPGENLIAARFDSWPDLAGGADVVFGILAVHELRKPDERVGWFREARRSLAKGGRIVLVEHLRDRANLLAFGPGFFHFHSRDTWRENWEKAGLVLADELGITPWVRCFVLKSDD